MILSRLFGTITAPLFGTGIGDLPGVWPVYHRIRKTVRPDMRRPVYAQGSWLYLDPSDCVMAPQIYGTHCWEPFETEVFRKFVKEGMVVADIGANIGYYSLFASILVGKSGIVHAFEPTPKTYELLERNIGLNKRTNVITYHLAITDKDDELLTFHLHKDAPASNSLSIKGDGETIRVLSSTLDSILARRVDIIKMDIEGAEALALAGMKRIIRENPNLILFTEACGEALLKAGSSMTEYVNSLLRYFDLTILDERHKSLIPCHSPEDAFKAEDGKDMINLLCRRKEKVDDE